MENKPLIIINFKYTGYIPNAMGEFVLSAPKLYTRSYTVYDKACDAILNLYMVGHQMRMYIEIVEVKVMYD